MLGTFVEIACRGIVNPVFSPSFKKSVFDFFENEKILTHNPDVVLLIHSAKSYNYKYQTSKI